MSAGIFERFLQIPSLDFSSEAYPYGSFETDSEGGILDEFTIPSQLMIGKQAEHCFEHYIRSSNRYQLLAHNVQIQGAEATIGELDYLLFDTRLQRTLHVELACKFYLYDPGKTGWSAWTGPNRKDSLDKKLEKLEQRQFPLLFLKETSRLLSNLHLNASEIVQLLCLKALLFVPRHNAFTYNFDRWSPSIVGQWMDLDELFEEDKHASYALPKKTQWLIPLKEQKQWMSLQELIPLITEAHQNQKTPLVYQKSNGVLKLFFIVWWNKKPSLA